MKNINDQHMDRNIDRSEVQAAGNTAVMDPEFHPETFSVDGYADRLMDELFVGVEYLLETGTEPETAATEPEYISMKTIEMPDFALPISLEPAGELVTAPARTDAAEAGDTTATTAATTAIAPPSQARPDWSFRILWGLSLISLAGATAMVMTQWQSYRSLLMQLSGQAPVAETVALAPTSLESPNQQFATYVQRSLEVLKDQQAINQANQALNPGTVAIVPPTSLQIPSTSALPAVPAAPSAATATPSQQQETGTVLERIYIPVYQTPNGFIPVVPGVPVPPSMAALPGGAIATNPSSPASPSAPSTAPAPAAAAKPSSPAAKSSPSQTQSSPANPSSQPASTNPTVAAAPPAAPQPEAAAVQTLVGLLELGDSSAALFEVNGVTRRFSLGEKIGNSGWSLAEIKAGEAVIRRNGEVKSVYVGQTF